MNSKVFIDTTSFKIFLYVFGAFVFMGEKTSIFFDDVGYLQI
jgi:hypothetical protein